MLFKVWKDLLRIFHVAISNCTIRTQSVTGTITPWDRLAHAQGCARHCQYRPRLRLTAPIVIWGIRSSSALPYLADVSRCHAHCCCWPDPSQCFQCMSHIKFTSSWRSPPPLLSVKATQSCCQEAYNLLFLIRKFVGYILSKMWAAPTKAHSDLISNKCDCVSNVNNLLVNQQMSSPSPL